MIGSSRFVAIYALLIGVILYLTFHHDVGVPIKKGFQYFPGSVSSWRMIGESSLSEDVQRVLRASDVLNREYMNEHGERVALYVGYHNGGKASGEIHSPKHCLPGSGWLRVSEVRKEIPVPGGKVKLVRAVYQKGDSRELFLYWYQMGEASISDEYSLKMAEIVNSVLRNRRDASFIRISVAFDSNEEKAAALGERFVSDFIPAIRGFLPS